MKKFTLLFAFAAALSLIGCNRGEKKSTVGDEVIVEGSQKVSTGMKVTTNE